MGKEEGAHGVGGCCCCLVMKLCPTLSSSMNWSPLDSSVLGISQAGILEWVHSLLQGNLRDPGMELVSPALAGRFFAC